MATMRMYCPSLKQNVEATITDGKRVASKGGSLRNILYGEYEGRRCLPKTVKEEVFAQHGFAAESEGESATYEPNQEPEGSTPATEPTNASFSDVYETESFCSSCGSHKRAEGCGCKSAETFEGGKSCSDCGRGIDKKTHMEFAGMCGNCYGLWNVCQNCGRDTDYYIQGKGFVLCEKCYDYQNAETFESEDLRGRMEQYGSWKSKADATRQLREINKPGFQIKQKGDLWAVFRPATKMAESFEAEKSTCRCGKDIANPKCKMCGSSICSDCDWQYANKCIECFGSHFNAESSPSSFDISWEDAQGVSSPSLPPEGIHFAEQGKNIKFCNGCNKRTNFEDGECSFCAFPEFGAEEDYHLNGETCEHCAEEVQLNAEGFCSECYEDLYLSETMAAEGISRNGKLVLGLAALGVGMAMALGSEKVASLLDKFNRK